MKKLRIIFMGTPKFAVEILDNIKKNNYKIVGVITAVDKPAGRGQKIMFSPVKEYAIKHKMKLLQPSNLKNETFLQELKSLNADLQIIVAFRMLPKEVWQMPKYGTVNLHASLLPQYRGAAPINWAIINGETKTGVTTFFIDDKIDTGAIILKSEIDIDSTDDAGSLHNKLMHIGYLIVLQTIIQIESENVNTTIQTEVDHIKTAYKLNKENCRISWLKSGYEINNLIRGLAPYPGAWSYIKDNQNEFIIKIFASKMIEQEHLHLTGKIICSKKTIQIAIKNGFIEILSLQLPNKKRMSTQEVLNGFTFSEDAVAF